MKVARIHEHGGPEVLVYEDAAEPKIRANQVLVRVRACALNHLDLFVRAGIPGMKFSMPHILGSDIAGEVVEVGELCERVKPGWRVLLAPGVSCRQCEQCLSGRDNFCRKFTNFGYAVDGGNTELLASHEYSVIQIPDDLSFEEAAAAPLVFLTAWHMLMGRAKLQAGEDVLVLAASSGVGMAAIQIAKLFHCRVIATAGGEQKLAKARELGADHVIDHYAQDISAEVKKITAQARRGCGGGTCGRGHLAEEPGIADAGRAPGDVRRDHGLRRARGFALPVQQAMEPAGEFHGEPRRAAPGAEIRLPQTIAAGGGPGISAGGRSRKRTGTWRTRNSSGKFVLTP